MKQIALTQGKYALVSNYWYKRISRFKWSARRDPKNGKWYALRTDYHKSKSYTILMHRVIMKAKQGQRIDHRDGDGLNNDGRNLRYATAAQNAANRRIQLNSTSGFAGVSWHKKTKRWCARIKYHGKRISLGYFKTREEAARKRDIAARKYHKAFAQLNFNKRVS